MELVPMIKRIVAILEEEPDKVTRMKVIEFVIADYARRAGSVKNAKTITAAMYKHADQLLAQYHSLAGL
jgi:hypothetical protein